MIALARPQKPVAPEVNVAGIPLELCSERRWVCWRYKWIEPKGKKPGRWTKEPRTVRNGSASSTDAATWASFDDAYDAYQGGVLGFDGVGFMLGDEWWGVDVDGISDHAEADKFIVSLGTYAETSPSMTGAKAIGRGGENCDGKLGTGRRWKGFSFCKEVEVYSTGRYFTITGGRIDIAPATVGDNGARLKELVNEIDGLREAERNERAKSATNPTPAGSGSSDLTDDDILRIIPRTKQAEKFKTLWSGDASIMGDNASAADSSLCSILAFYSHGNVDQIDRLFRRSGLYREKWDRDDYRKRTIDGAVSCLGGKYFVPAEAAECVQLDTRPETESQARELAKAPAADRTGRFSNVEWRKVKVKQKPVKILSGEPDDDGESVEVEKRLSFALHPAVLRANYFREVAEVNALGRAALFVLGADNKPQFLPDADSIFALAKNEAEVQWAKSAHRNGDPVSRAELQSDLKANPVARYQSIAEYPHYPLLPDTFYCPFELPPPNPARVAELLDHMNPATDIDRTLIHALMLTTVSGIPAGTRPAFVIASDHGRGAGKSATANAVSAIVGGAIDISLNKRADADRVKQRILHNGNATKRVAGIDNAKGTLNDPDIEQMITAPVISGHKLYAGDESRPNYLTWIITANAASMSRDLADRSVIIKIGKPKRSDFISWSKTFIEQHRAEIIATLFATLQAPDACAISSANRDRWAAWQDNVLAKLPNGDAVAAAIVERRPDVDADSEDWAEIEGEIKACIVAAGFDPEGDVVAVPLSFLAKRLTETTGLRWTPRGVATKLGDFAGVAGAECFTKNPSRAKGGRTWLWTGPEAFANAKAAYPNWDNINPVNLERRVEYGGRQL